ncbi:hypothetical protein AB0I51_23060 [Streptomyces sp. NPDC050549]|uniref:hypothetical protein n=1 Tax=Streptomyces sp. NPDC050549 TaxID=3155406 RepID=UPI00342A0D8A
MDRFPVAGSDSTGWSGSWLRTVPMPWSCTGEASAVGSGREMPGRHRRRGPASRRGRGECARACRSREEARGIADMAVVAEACDRWNIPLMAMMCPRGPRVTDPRDPELVSVAVTVAAELGADLIKTYALESDVRTFASTGGDRYVTTGRAGTGEPHRWRYAAVSCSRHASTPRGSGRPAG